MRPAFALLIVSSIALAHVARAAIPPPIHVTIHDHSFVPSVVHVKPGQPIVWLNTDGDFHTVTSGANNVDDRKWKSSAPLADGATFTVSLRKPGTYRYFCLPHQFQSSMHGTIIVER